MTALPTIDYEHVRQQVAERMKTLGFSHHGLADATGTDQATLSKFLAGKNSTASLEYIEAWAVGLSCRRHDLTGEQPLTIVQMIEAARLHASTQNPRHEMDPDRLDELMHSIIEMGILQNLTVRPDPASPEAFFVVSGHRRLAAVELAIERGELPGEYRLPCRVIEGDDTEALTEALVENLHREDMHPLDEADAYEKLQEWAKCSAAEVARRVGKEPRYVQQRLALHEKLSVKVKGAFRQGQINFTQARALTGADEDVQEIMLQRALEGGYYAQADNLERLTRSEQEAKQRRLEAASKPQPADSMFATPEEKAAHERQVAERKQQEKDRLETLKKQFAEQGAQEEAEGRKAAQFNTLFRSALRDSQDRIAKNALLDLLRPISHQSLCSSVVGHLQLDSLGPLSVLLGIDAPPNSEERPPEEWFTQAFTAIIALDDGKGTEILLAMIASTASPAKVASRYQAYSYEIGGAVYTYSAEIQSPSARALAEKMKVHVPTGLVPLPDEPEEPEEETDGEEQDPADEDAEEEEAA